MEDRHFPPLILLAGGQSRRMGMPKGLFLWRKEYWILNQLRNFSAVNKHPKIVLVLGFDADQYFQAITSFDKAVNNRLPFMNLDLSIVINPHPEEGQFSSLMHAWKWARQTQPQAAFVLPIDVPCPHKSVFQQLWLACSQEVQACIPTWKDRRGHPVLLHSGLLDNLLAISPQVPEARLDVQLDKLPAGSLQTLAVDDERVVLNLNTPQDFRQFVDKT